jgi:hypothetical protein
MQLAESIGRLKASGQNLEIAPYVQELLQVYRRSTIQDVNLQNFPRPSKMAMPLTEDGVPERHNPITLFSLQVSGLKGENWHGIINKMLDPVSNQAFTPFGYSNTCQ